MRPLLAAFAAAALSCTAPALATKPAPPIEADFRLVDGASDGGPVRFEWNGKQRSSFESGRVVFSVTAGEEEPLLTPEPAATARVFDGTRGDDSTTFTFDPDAPGRYRVSATFTGTASGRKWTKNRVLFLDVPESGPAVVYKPPMGSSLDFGGRDGGYARLEEPVVPKSDEKGTSFIVKGSVFYTSRAYTTGGFTGEELLPLKKIRIEIRDVEGVGSELVQTALTDNNGSFAVTVPNNNDGNGTGRDIFLRAVTETSMARVEDHLGFVYYVDSHTVNNWGGGTLDFGLRTISVVSSGPFNIWDSVLRGYNYCVARGDSIPPKIKVAWAKNNEDYIGSTYYKNPELRIYLLGGPSDSDEFDDDVIIHEYGHVAMCHYSYTKAVFDTHDWDTKTNNPLAWSEGWANYFSCAARNSKHFVDHVGPDSPYHNVETLNNTLSGSEKAEDVEGAVAGVLFDIFDGPNDGSDTLSAGSNEIWEIFTGHFNASKQTRFRDFYDGWKTYTFNDLGKVDSIMKEFGMTFAGGKVDFPAADGTVLQRGKSYAVKWSGFNGANVDIKIYNGSNLVQTASASTANDGTFNWYIDPGTVPISDNLKVRITALPSSNQYDWSDYSFRTVDPPPVITVNGSTVNGNIADFDEYDWYSFSASTQATYTIETFAGGMADGFMVLYGPNSQGTFITQDDDGGEGTMPKIVRNLSPGTYYVRMEAFYPDDIGTYTIRVRK